MCACTHTYPTTTTTHIHPFFPLCLNKVNCGSYSSCLSSLPFLDPCFLVVEILFLINTFFVVQVGLTPHSAHHPLIAGQRHGLLIGIISSKNKPRAPSVHLCHHIARLSEHKTYTEVRELGVVRRMRTSGWYRFCQLSNEGLVHSNVNSYHTLKFYHMLSTSLNNFHAFISFNIHNNSLRHMLLFFSHPNNRENWVPQNQSCVR